MGDETYDENEDYSDLFNSDDDSDSDEEDGNDKEMWKKIEEEDKKLKALEQRIKDFEQHNLRDTSKVKQNEPKKRHYRFQKNKKPRKPYNVNDAYMRKKGRPELFTEEQKDQNRKENHNFASRTKKTMNDELGEPFLSLKQRRLAEAWLRNEIGDSSFEKRDIFNMVTDTNDNTTKKKKKVIGNKKKRRSHKRRR